MLNPFPYYRYNNYYNRINYYNPTFRTPYQSMPSNIENKDNTDIVTNNDNIKSEENTKSRHFNLGPLSLNDDRLSLFGFNFYIDDIIIIGLILILLLDFECNLPLIIVLGLMLFNISISSLNLF